MRKKYLLGATVNKDLVFGEMEITTRNGYREFSASFDEVRPFNGSDFDAVEYYNEWLDGIDKEWKYDACERYECAPQELANMLASESSYDPRDVMDCSLFPEEIEVDGNKWYFESGSCGQHDTRDEMEVYTNKEAYCYLLELWDNYHLKKIDDEVQAKVENVLSMLEAVDTEKWIREYIHKECGEFDMNGN